MVQVRVNAFYRTTRVWGGTKDHHSALLGGHITLNTVILGEGISEYQVWSTQYGPHPRIYFEDYTMYSYGRIAARRQVRTKFSARSYA